MISSNLIYHTGLNHMQTYHTNGFLHLDKIIKNTAHIAQTKMAVVFFFNNILSFIYVRSLVYKNTIHIIVF